MNKSAISSWARQTRHRARKLDVHNNLEIGQIQRLLEEFNNRCAYCDDIAGTFDHPFPLKDGAPNIIANVLPACKKCKDIKKNNDLVWLYFNDYLHNDKYIELLRSILHRDDDKILKPHIQKATGIYSDEDGE